MVTKISNINNQRFSVARHSNDSIFDLKEGNASTEESIKIQPTKQNMINIHGDTLWMTQAYLNRARLKELDKFGKRKNFHRIVNKQIEFRE